MTMTEVTRHNKPAGYAFETLLFETKKRPRKGGRPTSPLPQEGEPVNHGAQAATSDRTDEAPDGGPVQAPCDGTTITANEGDMGSIGAQELVAGQNIDGPEPVHNGPDRQNEEEGRSVVKDGLRPMQDADGEPIGTVFPKRALLAVGNAWFFRERINAREQNIIEIRRVLDEDTAVLRAFFQTDTRTAYALLRGVSLESMLVSH